MESPKLCKVTGPGEALCAVEKIDEHNHLVTVAQRMRDNLFCELFSEDLFCCTYAHQSHGTTHPPTKCQKSLIPKNNYWGLKIASADQRNSCRVGIVLVLPFSSTQGLRSPCHLVPRQWVNIHFYPCGFQVTLAGKVYWSFILPEMATKLNHYFLFAQLKNIKCAVLQNSTRTLSLLPLLSSLACIDISCYARWAATALGNT